MPVELWFPPPCPLSAVLNTTSVHRSGMPEDCAKLPCFCADVLGMLFAGRSRAFWACFDREAVPEDCAGSVQRTEQSSSVFYAVNAIFGVWHGACLMVPAELNHPLYANWSSHDGNALLQLVTLDWPLSPQLACS